jgi:PKD repeat protein
MIRHLSRILLFYPAIYFIVLSGQLELLSQSPKSSNTGTIEKRNPNIALMMKPTAKIAPQHQEVIQGIAALFESQSSASAGSAIAKELWSGPGGQTGAGKTFTINTQELQPGTYPITLTVVDHRNISSTITAALVVNPPQQPQYTLSINVVPNRVQEGGSVKITANIQPSNPRIEYKYYYGDQSFSEWTRQAEIDHVYNSAGEFFVRAEARLSQLSIASWKPVPGIVSSNQEKVTITPLAQSVAAFLFPDRDNVNVNDAVSFQARLTKPLDGARYMFIFGDSLTSGWISDATVQHKYTSAGSYNTSLKVNWRGTVIASSPVTILVKQAEPVYSLNLRIDQRQVHTNKSIIFTAEMNPPSERAEYYFDFGDGTQSDWISSRNIRHRYVEAGTYIVKALVKQTDRVLAESQPETVRIIPVVGANPPQPSATLQVTPPSAKKGDRLMFAAEVDPPDPRTEYRFIFGDGNQRDWSINPRAEHEYGEANTYQAYVTTRIGSQLIAESPQIDIIIKPNQLEISPIWEVIGGAALVIIIGSIIKTYKKIKQCVHRPPVDIQVINAMTDKGEQFIGSGQSFDSDYEIQLRPVLDLGSQKIKEDSIVFNEAIEKEGM